MSDDINKINDEYTGQKVQVCGLSMESDYAWHIGKERSMATETNECTCLDSPNMLAGPCQACSGDDFETGEIVQVSNCTFIGGSTDDDVVVKFNSSPFEYCLPGSVIRHIPPAQCECGKQYAKIDEVTYCPDCTTAMTGLTEAELRQALAEPVVDNEVWDCDCGVVNDWIEETCIVCESPRPKLSPQPVEAKEPWKPGMRVLIEATIGEELDDDTCDLRIHTGLPVDAWIVAKLSQLRPLPVVQGEGVNRG